MAGLSSQVLRITAAPRAASDSQARLRSADMPPLRLALAVARVFLLYCFSSAFVNSSHSSDGCPPSTTIGFHPAVCSPDGNLALPLAFSSLEDAVLRSVSWYRDSPLSEHGYPPVVRLLCNPVAFVLTD